MSAGLAPPLKSGDAFNADEYTPHASGTAIHTQAKHKRSVFITSNF
jgi:hypothetical protein